MGEVTRADIRAYLDYAATNRGNSNVTRERKLAVIKSFFNYLVENEGLEANLAASIKEPEDTRERAGILNRGGVHPPFRDNSPKGQAKNS